MPLVAVFVAQLCLTLCNPRDCSLPGSSAQGTLQARMLERVAVPPPGISRPGIEPGCPSLQADSLPSEPPGTFLSRLYTYLVHCVYYVYKSFSQKVFVIPYFLSLH